ncbi:MAG: LemA family protein [Gammaproteobacteria bacterium]|nr:LemA family protein [Gammaproteobacteria bacterium]
MIEPLVAGLVAVVLWVVWTYNRFIKRRNQVKEAWSGIDVQLKRRYNLIPNLVEVVQGYAKHEKASLEAVTSLRIGSGKDESVAQRGTQESEISRVLRNLFAVAESYPDLKASTNFVDLQNNLDEIEQQIQYARRYYNGAVRKWNVLVESFPSNLIAGFFSFRLADFFEIEQASQRELPSVDF